MNEIESNMFRPGNACILGRRNVLLSRLLYCRKHLDNFQESIANQMIALVMNSMGIFVKSYPFPIFGPCCMSIHPHPFNRLLRGALTILIIADAIISSDRNRMTRRDPAPTRLAAWTASPVPIFEN